MNVTTVAVVVVAGLVLLVVVAMSRRRKSARAEWDDAPAALGMEPIAALDASLGAAILALHKPPVAATVVRQDWSLTHIYRYPEPGVDCYSVTIHLDETREVWEHGKTMKSERRDTRVVAVVAADSLAAPRVKLLPRATAAAGAGALAAMMIQVANAAIDTAAEQEGNRVAFADDSDFERRYVVLSPQPDAARAFLDSTRRLELLGLDGIEVSLDGSLLLVSSPTDAIAHRDRSLVDSLRAELENARRVLTVFT